jgi:hypothetical protein
MTTCPVCNRTYCPANMARISAEDASDPSVVDEEVCQEELDRAIDRLLTTHMIAPERIRVALLEQAAELAVDGDEPPVVLCRRTADGTQLVFFCPYCRADHFHGVGTPGGPVGCGDGHRVAHCHRPDSLYLRAGYVLREVP